MLTHLRTSLVAVVVAIGSVVVVTLRVATAPGPALRRSATDAERSEIAASIAGSERDWGNISTQGFPEDLWSQRDDFHGHEFQKVVQVAREKGVRVEDVLRAVDQDIHRRRARGWNV